MPENAPLPNSTYFKVKDILEEVGRGQGRSVIEVAEALRRSGPDSFAYWAPREEESSDRRRISSLPTIRTAIRLTRDLELITYDDDQNGCRLTADGRNALAEAEFDSTVADRTEALLRQSGYGYSDLVKVIDKLGSVQIADAETLYDKRPPKAKELSEERFRRLLSLLADAGGINYRTRRVYFPL